MAKGAVIWSGAGFWSPREACGHSSSTRGSGCGQWLHFGCMGAASVGRAEAHNFKSRAGALDCQGGTADHAVIHLRREVVLCSCSTWRRITCSDCSWLRSAVSIARVLQQEWVGRSLACARGRRGPLLLRRPRAWPSSSRPVGRPPSPRSAPAPAHRSAPALTAPPPLRTADRPCARVALASGLRRIACTPAPTCQPAPPLESSGHAHATS